MQGQIFCWWKLAISYRFPQEYVKLHEVVRLYFTFQISCIAIQDQRYIYYYCGYFFWETFVKVKVVPAT